jgi:hypothetical protein
MTPGEYRQREADRQSGLRYERISDRERFGEIQSIAQPEAAKPGSPLSIMQQQIAHMDLLLAELSAVRERALQAKAEGDAKQREEQEQRELEDHRRERAAHDVSIAPREYAPQGEAPGSFL